jgi:hypothetical protein
MFAGAGETGDISVPVQLGIHQWDRGPGWSDTGNHFLRAQRVALYILLLLSVSKFYEVHCCQKKKLDES